MSFSDNVTGEGCVRYTPHEKNHLQGYGRWLQWLMIVGILAIVQGCATWQQDAEDGQVGRASGAESAGREAAKKVVGSGDSGADPAAAGIVGQGQGQGQGQRVKIHACSSECKDLLDRLRAGFSWPETMNERVEAQIRYYQTHPEVLTRNLQRAQKYLHFVVTELEARNMPLELALLPYVESNYNPFAFSSGCAAGLWQFIPSTGEHYGLKQTWWYDGRRDIAASTRAALTYLNRLVTRFEGDWYLALAAYNAGQGAVSRMIARNQASNQPADYWNLPVSTETANYVPKLLALSRIIENPAKYGFELPALNNQPWFEFVDVQGQIDLALVSELTGLTEDEIIDLNPGFNRWATDPEGPHVLLVPIDRAAAFRQMLAAYPPEARVRWERYRIQPGDTLIAIARRFDTTVDILRNQNALKGHLIRVGDVLTVPRTLSLHLVDGTYQAGDNVQTSRAAQTPQTDQTSQTSQAARVAQTPQAARTSQAPQTSRTSQTAQNTQKEGNGRTPMPLQRVTYTVRPGDALFAIARRFSVAVNDLVRWNNITDPAHIRPGDRLTIHVDPTRAAESS